DLPKGRAGRVSVLIRVSSRGCSGSRRDAAAALDSGVGHGHRPAEGVVHLLGDHLDRSPGDGGEGWVGLRGARARDVHRSPTLTRGTAGARPGAFSFMVRA